MKFFGALLMFVSLGAGAQTINLKVKLNQPGPAISKTMWGLFFEDINLGADGGVYAELVKNRSFEFDMPMMGWDDVPKDSSNATALVINQGSASPANPRYLHIDLRQGRGYFLLSNEGFRGMGFKKDEKYNLTLQARLTENLSKPVELELVDEKGVKIGSGNVTIDSKEWKKYEVSITAGQTVPKGRLNLRFAGTGAVDVDMISMFPATTWKNRPGGLRNDLVQMLADIKPGFLRFPGGCIVEGKVLDNRYQWKKTVGNIEERETLINRWNTEFSHRSTPDYFQSFGLGFYEYFLLAEDIGAEPLPILNCGMACQFNSAEVVPLGELDPYIQDALDLIEFANGSEQTKWGKLRATMGHPAPFNLKLLGVGNEQWGEQYIERFTLFAKALKAKHPEVQLISSAGPYSDGPMFNYLNDTLRSMKVDLIDEHYYRPPSWFLKNARRYDKYDRNGPKVFAGEYAAHVKNAGSDEKLNTWQAAIAEAAFMTGLERNADIVQMASYAPLFAHAEGWQWTPDLIWFNNLQSYGTPNYYVQKMYGNNKGSRVVPLLMNNESLAGQDSIYATACIDDNSKELIIKIVNTAPASKKINISLEGKGKLLQKLVSTQLQSADQAQLNTFTDPNALVPKETTKALKGQAIAEEIPGYSFTIFRIGMK
ncbi:MAG: alpha-L-arabinofuranosidase C-terminal domain-containing protein [Flavitalea sp.]